MNRNQILDVIKQLACSQGFYSRMYRTLMDIKQNNIDAFNDYMSELEEQNFGDAVDMILYFEC